MQNGVLDNGLPVGAIHESPAESGGHRAAGNDGVAANKNRSRCGAAAPMMKTIYLVAQLPVAEAVR